MPRRPTPTTNYSVFFLLVFLGLCLAVAVAFVPRGEHRTLSLTGQVSTVPTPLTPANNSTISTTTPTFTWNGVSGFVQYRVQILENGAVKRTGTPNATSWTLSTSTPLDVGHSYTWRVATYNNGTIGTFSASLSFAIVAPPMPLSPNDVISTTTPTFTWTAAAGAPSYSLEVIANPGSSNTIVVSQTGLTGTSWTMPSNMPFPAGFYSWRVRVTGAGNWSAPLNFSIPAAPNPTSPGSNAIVATTTPTFTWDLPTGPLPTSYVLEVRDTQNNAVVITQSIAGINSSWTSSQALSLWHTYSWKMTSIVGTATGLSSPSLTFTVVSVPVLSAPSGTVNTLTPTFSWTGVPGALNYTIEVKDVQNASPGLNGFTTSTTWTPSSDWQQVGNTIVGHSYSWRVKAVVAGQTQGYWSDSLNFSIASFPAATLLAPADNSTIATTTPTLTWSAVPGAVSYTVFVADMTQSALVQGPISTNSTSYVVPSGVLSSGHTYGWTIWSHNGTGLISFSHGHFTVNVPSPTSPVLLTPANGSTTTTITTFTWNGSSASYNLRLIDMNTFTPLSQNNLTSTSWTSPSLTAGHTYAWMITTNDSPPLQSSAWTFSIPAPSVARPNTAGAASAKKR